jgi:AraC family transcriptional regulator, regulatory protein of adaptative response / methylated-DNA-[protein]-cysteine methyltransferase
MQGLEAMMLPVGPAKDDTISRDAAWEAVLRRDRDSDGEFVFAVRTTGIFCRPSCPARRPKRENVEFLPSAEIARAAGYRACKRCNPESAARTLGEKRVKTAASYIEQHPGESLSLDALAARVTLSPFHLQREFKRVFGLTPRAYQNAVRTGRLKSRLSAGDSVSRAAYEAGFGSSRAVYESAAKTMGMTPGEFRRGAKGLRIQYDFANSPVGTILIAATDKGICSVSIGDDRFGLERALSVCFPGASLEKTGGRDPKMRRWAEAVAALASGRSAAIPPLDLQGSAFQLRVWEALQRIPLGETRSYSEIAAQLGAGGASRAVGRACATNPAALVVPCHRVVQTSGALGGYRWGLDRKKLLIEAEKGRLRRPASR